MFKYIFLLVNSISVLVYNLLLSDGVSITPKFPDKAKPNSEFVAEVIVNKSNVSGFAKLQLELPEGLTAKELENKGSTFSCTNGIIKFIWTALPAEESFVLKFNVIADGSCSGTKEIKGKFSYLLNNEKKQNEFGPVQVAFSENVAQTTSNTSTNSSNNTVPINSIASNSSNSSTTSDFNPVKKQNEHLSIHRKISKINDNSYRVEVVFFKDNILGFAKHTEKIPEGFKAKEEISSGASFNTNQTFVKYLWASLPDKEEMRISYIIDQISTPPANGVVKGEFIYLDQEETKKVYSDEDAVPLTSSIATSTSSQSNQVVPSNSTSNTNQSAVKSSTINNSASVNSGSSKSNNQSVSAGISDDQSKENQLANSNTNSKSNNNNSSAASNKLTAISSGAKSGTINYQVQVGAFRNNVTADKVAVELNLSEVISSDMHEGLNKFLVGSYSEYKQARNKRESLRSGSVKDAFVSAYNGQKRITVQEAIMITSQKWAP
jgi:hypothetical protein